MSFELPTELIDKIMEEAKEPIHKKLLKLDLFDLTCLKLELNRIYDMKCSYKKEGLRKYKDCIVNINEDLYLVQYINKRDIRVCAILEGDTSAHREIRIIEGSRYKVEDKKNNVMYSVYYQDYIYLRFENIKKIELVYDIPLNIFNWNRGIKD